VTYKFQIDLNVLLFTASGGSPLDPESVAEVFTRRAARSGLPTLQRPQAHAVVRSRRPALANASKSRHRPFPADDWMLYDMDSVAADGGSRARGFRFNRAGRLYVSPSEEGLGCMPRRA